MLGAGLPLYRTARTVPCLQSIVCFSSKFDIANQKRSHWLRIVYDSDANRFFVLTVFSVDADSSFHFKKTPLKQTKPLGAISVSNPVVAESIILLFVDTFSLCAVLFICQAKSRISQKEIILPRIRSHHRALKTELNSLLTSSQIENNEFPIEIRANQCTAVNSIDRRIAKCHTVSQRIFLFFFIFIFATNRGYDT